MAVFKILIIFVMTISSFSIFFVSALPPKARILVQYPLSEADNSSAIEVLNDVQNTETILTEQMLGGNIYLECLASYPIEWIYEGDGFPDSLTFLETRRAVKNFSDPSTYTFSVRVDLLEVKETSTGLYSCRKLGTPQVLTFFYIYVPGKNIFLSDFSKKVILDIKAETVTLPCVVTNPRTKVLLFKVITTGSLEPINDVPFVPSEGFQLNITKYKDQDQPILGHYICMAVKEKKVLKILLESSKSEIVKVTPIEKHVNKTIYTNQIFKCEANENITIRLENDKNIPNVIHQELNDTNLKFHFIATLEIIQNETNSKDLFFGNFTIINCVTVDGNKVLHKWEYTNYGQDNIEFSYNSEHNLFLCCTSSIHRPVINRISCVSPMECQLKKHFCIRNKGKCSEHQQYNLNGISENCVGYPEPIEHNEDGMIQCFIGETMKEYYFAWGNGKLNNPILSIDHVSNNNDIMEIRTNHTGQVFVGEEIEISCHPNKFFFSNEPIWAFERFNGSIEIIDKSLLRDDLYFEKRVTIPKRRRTIKVPDIEIKALICLAPTWYSSKEWKNISIPITVVESIENEMSETTISSLLSY